MSEMLANVDPRYARLEFERRWRLDALPRKLESDVRLIEDGYIAGTQLRLRRALTLDGHVLSMSLTQRLPAAADGAAYWVTHIGLSKAEFARMRTLGTHRGLKRRHRLQRGEQTVAIDQWLAPRTGLILAKVVFGDESGMLDFVPPSAWANEVTGESAFSGAALCGLPPEVAA